MTEEKKSRVISTCFPGGRHRALTMSYDDGRVEDYRLVPLFNKYGIKGTFHLNSGRFPDSRRIPISEYRKLYQGHEVSAHTYSHPLISRCPLELVVSQIIEDRKILEDAVDYPVHGLSYPCGSYSQDIIRLLPSLGICYARTSGHTNSFGVPKNFLEWTGTCHHDHNLLELGRQFLERDFPQCLDLMYVWGHSYEFTLHDNWNVIEEFCRMMSGNADIWYATNIQIVKYMVAANALEYTAKFDKVYNPSFQSVWIEVDGEQKEVKGGQLLNI